MGVTKGTATLRMVQFMQEVYGTDRTSFDFVLCIGESAPCEHTQTLTHPVSKEHTDPCDTLSSFR